MYHLRRALDCNQWTFLNKSIWSSETDLGKTSISDHSWIYFEYICACACTKAEFLCIFRSVPESPPLVWTRSEIRWVLKGGREARSPIVWINFYSHYAEFRCLGKCWRAPKGCPFLVQFISIKPKFNAKQYFTFLAGFFFLKKTIDSNKYASNKMWEECLEYSCTHSNKDHFICWVNNSILPINQFFKCPFRSFVYRIEHKEVLQETRKLAHCFMNCLLIWLKHWHGIGLEIKRWGSLVAFSSLVHLSHSGRVGQP